MVGIFGQLLLCKAVLRCFMLLGIKFRDEFNILLVYQQLCLLLTRLFTALSKLWVGFSLFIFKLLLDAVFTFILAVHFRVQRFPWNKLNAWQRLVTEAVNALYWTTFLFKLPLQGYPFSKLLKLRFPIALGLLLVFFYILNIFKARVQTNSRYR